jgi:hypothetical protein
MPLETRQGVIFDSVNELNSEDQYECHTATMVRQENFKEDPNITTMLATTMLKLPEKDKPGYTHLSY